MFSRSDRSRRSHRWWGLTVAAGVAGAVVIATLTLTRASQTAAAPTEATLVRTETPNPISVSASGCASGWKAPRSGRPVFHVANTTTSAYDVDLVGPDQQTVYAEIETLGPHTQRPLPVMLPPGRYAWRCTRADGLVTYSAPATVSGAAVSGAHPFVPVTYNELSAAAIAYRTEVAKAMQVLEGETAALRAAVDRGGLASARDGWLAAHMQYERLGAAYGTFGDYDSEINGRVNGLPRGVSDPGFEGFHRLELGLFAGAADTVSTRALAPVADRLDRDVRALVAAFPHLQTAPNDVALRAHEILENALQFEVTGETDYGSHTNLATVRANVDGTVMALTAITPLLHARDTALLARATDGLHDLAAVLDTYRVGGRWTPVDQLSRAEHEQLDATLGGLLEQLSPIPDLLELPKDADDS